MMDDRPFNQNMNCLSDETLTLWTQGLLSPQERAVVEAHAHGCAVCRELLQTLMDVNADERTEMATPRPLIASARELIKQAWENHIGSILLRISEGAYSAAQTTGRILFAPWMEPHKVLRSDGNANPSTVVIETAYRNMRCVVESSRTPNGCHTLKAEFTTVDANQPIDPTLFILYEDNEEIESQMSSAGTVVFEDLPPG
ncbi:MAG: hypothetical protein JNN05_03635, partial [Candidatus Omnitrophica bacterium]|nr:hypothetical protein [Candidatus Omnitrophota bacterium]